MGWFHGVLWKKMLFSNKNITFWVKVEQIMRHFEWTIFLSLIPNIVLILILHLNYQWVKQQLVKLLKASVQLHPGKQRKDNIGKRPLVLLAYLFPLSSLYPFLPPPSFPLSSVLLAGDINPEICICAVRLGSRGCPDTPAYDFTLFWANCCFWWWECNSHRAGMWRGGGGGDRSGARTVAEAAAVPLHGGACACVVPLMHTLPHARACAGRRGRPNAPNCLYTCKQISSQITFSLQARVCNEACYLEKPRMWFWFCSKKVSNLNCMRWTGLRPLTGPAAPRPPVFCHV